MTYDEPSAKGLAKIAVTLGVALTAIEIIGAGDFSIAASTGQPKANPQLTCKLAQVKTCVHVFPWYSIVEIDGKKYCLSWQDEKRTTLLISRTTKRFTGKEECAAG